MKKLSYWRLCGLSVLVSGCAATTMLPESSIFEKYPSVANLKSQLAEAQTQEVNLTAPEAFNNASKTYAEALKLAAKDNPQGDMSARAGLSQLSVAKKQHEEAQYILEDVLAARSKAKIAGAPVSQGGLYMDAEKDLLKLTTLIESGSIVKAKAGRAELLATYRNLELLALKASTVENSQKALAQAKKRDIDDFAPKTFNLAREDYQLALNVLNADRNETAIADIHAKRSLWNVQRANQIAEVLRHFDSSDYSEEDKILWYQEQLSKLAAPINSNVPYHLPNKEVINSLNTEIKNLMDENIKLMADKQALVDERNKIRATFDQQLTTSRANYDQELMSKEAYSEKFNIIQSLFDNQEADVYRQSNNVLIRAHGFFFPSGKSEIDAVNFSLLNKISESIKQFPNSKIVVSGHTDSLGSDELNMKLSEARAAKVAAFLNQVANIRQDRIESYGFGESKPVSNNETKAGRDANRRVEILIVN